MYRKGNPHQLKFQNFYLPFGGKLIADVLDVIPNPFTLTRYIVLAPTVDTAKTEAYAFQDRLWAEAKKQLNRMSWNRKAGVKSHIRMRLIASRSRANSARANGGLV